MAAKRLHDQSDSDPDEKENKRIETTASCISMLRTITMVRSLEPLTACLEPMFRKVVREEAENVVSRWASKFSRSSSLQIRSASDQATTLKLIFTKSLLLPIFTNSKIVDLDRSPLQVHLINTNAHGQVPLSPIKLEIVALDGDFPGSDNLDWTSQEFDDHILKARENKRPLLTGDVSVTLRNGKAVLGDLVLTDNSRWVRSGHFRIGARVSAGSFPERIKEAITGPFQVRDHRGELCQKHFPPSLTDEVWRLKKISRDGVFCNKLNDERIYNVQDFLTQLHLNEPHLKGILAMPEKLWDATVKHALTCQMGSKRYIYHAHDKYSTLLLSPTCQVLAASVNGKFYNQSEITGREIKAYVQEITRTAIMQWDQLQEVDEPVDPITILSRYVDHTNYASSSAGANTGQASLPGYMNTGIEFSSQANNQKLWEGGEETIHEPIHPVMIDSQFATSMDEDSYDFTTPDFNYQNNK